MPTSLAWRSDRRGHSGSRRGSDDVDEMNFPNTRHSLGGRASGRSPWRSLDTGREGYNGSRSHIPSRRSAQRHSSSSSSSSATSSQTDSDDRRRSRHRSSRRRSPRGRRAVSSSSSSSTSSASSSLSSSTSSSLASVDRQMTRGGNGSRVAQQVRWVPERSRNADGTDIVQPMGFPTPPPTWKPAFGAVESDLYGTPRDAPGRGAVAAMQATATGAATREPSGSRRGLQRVFTPPVSPRGDLASLRPSSLLTEVVRSVAYYRSVPCPREIYPEVILAFDEYLARGITLMKFIPNGPPHHRFFAIRFLDLQHRRADGRSGSAGRGGAAQWRAVPEAVFCWYRTAKSVNMRRYFPLADLRGVRRGGAGHKYVEKRRTKTASGNISAAAGARAESDRELGIYAHNDNTEDNYLLLRNGKKGIFNKYINDAFVLQLAFRSLLTNSEEVVAVQAPNPTVLLALHVVADYISRIGRDL